MEETPRSGHSPPQLAADVATVAMFLLLTPVDQAEEEVIRVALARARPIKAGAVAHLPLLAIKAAEEAVLGM
jgi:hypothetical protein